MEEQVTFERRAAALRERHDAVALAEPRLRARNRAARLGVTEAELVAAGCGGITVTPLAADPQTLVRELGTLGEVLAISRNEWCVHERHGRYEEIQAQSAVGLVLGPDIDLRMFFKAWKYTFGIVDKGRRSIQFFDGAGVAIHKVYQLEDDSAAAFDTVFTRFASTAGPVWPVIVPYPPSTDLAVVDDAVAVRERWLAMTDTHQFVNLLRHFGASRQAVLRAAGTDLAQRVGNDVPARMLTEVAASGLEIMCFVGNRGIIQIHSGPVSRLLRTGEVWFNVLDPRFNLHMNDGAIAETWIVNKPTSDGWVTSIEAFTDTGEMVVQFFGVRKPGQPELADWRSLLVSLSPLPLAA